MNKALLLPIVALLALTLKQIFNIELSESDTDTIVDGVLALCTLAGIFMQPKGGEKKE